MAEKEEGVETPKEEAEESAQAAVETDVDTEETEESGSEKMIPFSDMRKLRTENATRRKENAALQKRLDALEGERAEEKRAAELAGMEESEKLNALTQDAIKKAEQADARAALYRSQSEQTAKRSAIISAAMTRGFTIPADAAELINLDNIQIGEDGTVDEQQVKLEVDALAEDRPQYLRQALPKQKTFGATNSPGGGPPASVIRYKAGKNVVQQLKDTNRAFTESNNVRQTVESYNDMYVRAPDWFRKGYPYIGQAQEEG